jgi:hypothetical protein
MGTPHTSCQLEGGKLMTAQDPRPPWAGTPIPAWHQSGTCRALDVRLFFEPQYEQLACRVCSSCPVRNECRTWSIAAGSSLHGIWAGTTWREREQIRKTERRKGVA